MVVISHALSVACQALPIDKILISTKPRTFSFLQGMAHAVINAQNAVKWAHDAIWPEDFDAAEEAHWELRQRRGEHRKGDILRVSAPSLDDFEAL